MNPCSFPQSCFLVLVLHRMMLSSHINSRLPGRAVHMLFGELVYFNVLVWQVTNAFQTLV